VHLAEWLCGIGIPVETAEQRGWKALRNGELMAASAAAGFDCVLTRDQLFAESAARAWRENSGFCVVVVNLARMPGRNRRSLRSRAGS
jgi:hypothetical protein